MTTKHMTTNTGIKMKRVINYKDFKTEDGLWSKGFGENRIFYQTRSAYLYSSLEQRCNPSNSVQQNGGYLGITNNFIGFQDFADWCQDQYGYTKKEANGRYWSIDKDIKILGNTSYSREACIFVPAAVNNLFLKSTPSKSGLPIGVSQTYQGYSANFNTRLGRKTISGLQTPEEAHKLWQNAKIEYLIHAKKSLELTPELKTYINFYIDLLEEDIKMSRETKYFTKGFVV